MFRNVCRLCFGTDDLIWIFGERMADNMKEIIHVTSGVEISRTDTVTQMVCNTCCQVTIKMYQFRTKSIKNDKDLKARCAGYNIAQLTNAAANVAIRKEQVISTPPTPTPAPAAVKSPVPLANLAISVKPKPPPPQIPQRYKSAHPSIKDVVRANPTILLPDSCLKSHVGAYITLLTDEVDDYYREKRLTDAQIREIKRDAYERANAAKRKTPPPPPKKRAKPQRDETANQAKKAKLSVDSVEVRKLNVISVRTSCDSVQEKDVHPPRTKTVKTPSDKSYSSEDLKLHDVVSPILNSLLIPNDKKVAISQKRDEITLKSLLKGGKQPGSTTRLSATAEDRFVNIETSSSPPPPLPSDSEEEVIRPRRIGQASRGFLTVPEEEFEFFTSRPFVNDKHTSDRSSSVVDHSENAQDGSKKPDDAHDSDSDRIVFDLDSTSSTSASTIGSSRDKSSFAEALRLVPKGPETGSNQPDLSLVSLANKTHTLYICRVCDSHHTSLKEMKLHEKRTHTKCPFCNKRFRTLANRDEHVANSCTINRSPVQLKNFKLELKRVDEDEEIRKRYPSAFEVVADEPSVENDEQTDRDKEHSLKTKETGVIAEEPKQISSNKPEEVQKVPVIDVETFVDTPSSFCDGFTADAIHELESFLNYAEVVPTKSKKNMLSLDDASDDVICISDEEADASPPTPAPVANKKSAEMSINIVNSEILNNVNIHDNDLNVLKSILSHNKIRQNVTKQLNQWNLTNNLIIDGSTPRVKIFKNLRKYLDQYKIPIEIKHDTAVSVQYQPRTPPATKNLTSLWTNLPVKTLLPLKMSHPSATNTQAVKPVSPQVLKRTNPQAVKSPNSQNLKAPGTTQQSVLLNGQIGRSLLTKRTLQKVSPVQTRPPTVHKPPLPTKKKLVAVQLTEKKATSVQNNVSTANMILTSSSGTLSSSTPIVLNATCANRPVILNGTANSMLPSQYPFILVPSSLLPTTMQNYTVNTSMGPATVSVKTSVGAAVTSTVQPPPTADAVTPAQPLLTVNDEAAATSIAQGSPNRGVLVTSGAPQSLLINKGGVVTTVVQRPLTVTKGAASSVVQSPPTVNKEVAVTSIIQPSLEAAANSTDVGTVVTSAIQPSPTVNLTEAAANSAPQPSTSASAVVVLTTIVQPLISGDKEAAVTPTEQQSSDGTHLHVEKSPDVGNSTTVSPEEETPVTVGSGEPSSIAVAQLESITQSLMPPVSQETTGDRVTVSDVVNSVVSSMMENPVKNPQPAIRVRNLKELS